jgi:hypothetical protein
VFSFGVGVEKIRCCNAELMRWVALWEASTGLSRGQRPRQWGTGGWGIAGAEPFRLQVRFKGIGYSGVYQKEYPQRDEAFCRRGTGKFFPNTFRAGGNVRGRDPTVPVKRGTLWCNMAALAIRVGRVSRGTNRTAG